MESYRLPINETWYAVIYKCLDTNQVGIFAHLGKYKAIKEEYERNEPSLKILEIKLIKNVSALKYFEYHSGFPVLERKQKFDFFKYVLNANLSNKNRNLFSD